MSLNWLEVILEMRSRLALFDSGVMLYQGLSSRSSRIPNMSRAFKIVL
jgi:hypothetical protein